MLAETQKLWYSLPHMDYSVIHLSIRVSVVGKSSIEYMDV